MDKSCRAARCQSIMRATYALLRVEAQRARRPTPPAKRHRHFSGVGARGHGEAGAAAPLGRIDENVDHLFLGSRRERPNAHDWHDTALAAVHRNAANLLSWSDNELYAAGGVPLLVDAFGRICIASTGADRAVAAPAGALRIKPANGHMKASDLAICRGRPYTPGSFDLEIAMERRPFKFHGVRIKELDGDAIDTIVVRIDAAFKTAWWAMNRSIPRTRPQGFELLRAQFAEACGADGDDGLTVALIARCRVSWSCPRRPNEGRSR